MKNDKTISRANTILNRTAILLAFLVVAPYLKPESAQAQIVVERGVIEAPVRQLAEQSDAARQQHSEAEQAAIRAEVDGEREQVKPQAIQRAQHDCDVEEIGCTAGNVGTRLWDWWRG